MIGSYPGEQQAFSEHPNVSERPRPEWTGLADLPESEAIQRAQHGDGDAFERIYQSYCRRVYALCLRVTRNPAEAEDLTQEAFLTVFRKIQTFRGESAFSTWLHRITVNLALMRLRRKSSREISFEETAEQDGNRGGTRKALTSPDLRLAGSFDRLHLARAIDRLGPCHKLVVVLHDIQGYTHKEIARIMDWSIGGSKARLHRARMRLRELLQENVSLGCVAPERAT
jgi:RNA polymerase sigma-70 factor, ECF subfamily